MPTLESVTERAQRLNHAARDRAIGALQRVIPDATYASEYKHFKKWVIDNQDLLQLDGKEGRWITRLTADMYFQHEVVNRKVERATARRIVSGLQWYVHHREYCLEDFSVENPVVNACIDVQQEMFLSNDNTTDKDPHKDLKDVLPMSSRLALMTHVYEHRHNDWAQAALCLTYGQNAAVRGASARKLTLSDLRLSQGFGPEKDGANARALMLVLRKGGAHKDRFSTNKQVCMWRHRHYLCCSVFTTAAAIISKLRDFGDNLNFKKKTKERASWWDIDLLDWNFLDGE
jgi:hypothetical protein